VPYALRAASLRPCPWRWTRPRPNMQLPAGGSPRLPRLLPSGSSLFLARGLAVMVGWRVPLKRRCWTASVCQRDSLRRIQLLTAYTHAHHFVISCDCLRLFNSPRLPPFITVPFRTGRTSCTWRADPARGYCTEQTSAWQRQARQTGNKQWQQRERQHIAYNDIMYARS